MSLIILRVPFLQFYHWSPYHNTLNSVFTICLLPKLQNVSYNNDGVTIPVTQYRVHCFSERFLGPISSVLIYSMVTVAPAVSARKYALGLPIIDITGIYPYFIYACLQSVQLIRYVVHLQDDCMKIMSRLLNDCLSQFCQILVQY